MYTQNPDPSWFSQLGKTQLTSSTMLQQFGLLFTAPLTIQIPLPQTSDRQATHTYMYCDCVYHVCVGGAIGGVCRAAVPFRRRACARMHTCVGVQRYLIRYRPLLHRCKSVLPTAKAAFDLGRRTALKVRSHGKFAGFLTKRYCTCTRQLFLDSLQVTRLSFGPAEHANTLPAAFAQLQRSQCCPTSDGVKGAKSR